MLRSEFLATVDQVSPSVLSAGNEESLRLSKVGQLFTADWKMRLLLAGKLFRLSVGTVSGEGGISRVVGGGADTDFDLDEPQMAIGVPSGYYLIPIEVRVSVVVDADTNADMGEILVCMDRSNNVPAGTVTVATLYNLLDGAASFPGTAAHTVTADYTNPANEEILDADYISAREFVSDGSATNITNGIALDCQLHYQPKHPPIVAGPCHLTVYWGGTKAVTALAMAVVGVIPTSWVPIS